jgi:DNA polymerase-3 subunit delta
MPELRIEDLSTQLSQGLAPVYLLAGEEPLRVEQALDELRAYAREQGFTERDVLHVDTGFNWDRLTTATDNLSLFSTQRLLELRMPNGKPGRDGSAALKAYLDNPPTDTVLVVIAGRLEPAQRKSAWAQAITRAGVMSYAWPLRRAELPQWINQRAYECGLSIDAEAAALLAERNEGNLLALAQEIEKLALITTEGHIDLAQTREAVTDSARFAIFDLPEAITAGDVARTLRIIQRLRVEGEQPVLVLWGLARDLRVLADLQLTQSASARTAEVMSRHRVWKNRQSVLERLAHSAPRYAWAKLLARAAAADRAIKGAEARRPWDELVELSTRAAGLAAQARHKGK